MSALHSLYNVDRLSQLFFLDPEPSVISDEEMGRKLVKLPPARASRRATSSVSDDFFVDPCRVPRIFRNGVWVDHIPMSRREWTEIEGRKTGLLSLSPKDTVRVSHLRPVSLDSGLRLASQYPGPVRKHSHRNSAPPSLPSPSPARPVLAPIITSFDPRRKTYSNPKLLPLVNPQPMYPKYLAAAGAPSLTPGPPPSSAPKKTALKKFVVSNPDPKSASPQEWVVVDASEIPRSVNPTPVAAATKLLSDSSALTKDSGSATLVNEDISLPTPKAVEQPTAEPPRSETPRPLPTPPRLNSQVIQAIDILLEQVSTKPLPLLPRNSSNFTLEQERRFSTASISTFWSTSSFHSRSSSSSEEGLKTSNVVDWSEIENFLTKGGKKMEPDVSVQSSHDMKLVKDLLRMRVAQAGLEEGAVRSIESYGFF